MEEGQLHAAEQSFSRTISVGISTPAGESFLVIIARGKSTLAVDFSSGQSPEKGQPSLVSLSQGPLIDGMSNPAGDSSSEIIPKRNPTSDGQLFSGAIARGSQLNVDNHSSGALLLDG